MIEFIEMVIPPTKTHQQKRVSTKGGVPVFFKSKEQREGEATFDAILMPHRPETPLDGPVNLTVVACWPHLKSTPKRDRDKVLPHTSKPDADNWVKSLVDRMVVFGFLRDDCLVVNLSVAKRRGPVPFIRVKIEPYEVAA